MEHPYDPYEKYLMLVEDYIIRAPVPPMVIPEVTIPASSVWNVKSNITSTPLYSRLPSYTAAKTPVDKIKSDPSSYAWQGGSHLYHAGEYVTYQGYIWCALVDNAGKEPGNQEQYWETVTSVTGSGGESSTSGGKYDPGTIIENIAGGASVTKLADYSATYMRVRSALGKVGYIKRADCEETATDPEGTVVPSRTIIDQLFRIYSVSSEDDTHTVKVSARHISYDYQKNALYDCQLNETDPATAIALIQGSLMYEDNRLIACDMTEPTIKADYSFQNPVQALLDPDEGVAGQLRAKVLRDNEDIFILDNSNPRQGPGITYGVNLRGVSWERNIEDIVTRIIPRADDGNKGKLYLDELFVDSEHIDDFAVISIEVLDSEYSVGQKIEKADGTEITLTREDVLQRMREEAEKRYSVDKCDAVLVTLDVQFLLLGDTEQYKQYRGLQHVNIYDQITVKTGPSGMEITAQVTGYEWDCLMRRYNEITVGRIYGQNRRQVAGFQMATGAITYSKLAPGLINKLKGEADNG
jgi:phage minor structural protein